MSEPCAHIWSPTTQVCEQCGLTRQAFVESLPAGAIVERPRPKRPARRVQKHSLITPEQGLALFELGMKLAPDRQR